MFAQRFSIVGDRLHTAYLFEASVPLFMKIVQLQAAHGSSLQLSRALRIEFVAASPWVHQRRAYRRLNPDRNLDLNLNLNPFGIQDLGLRLRVRVRVRVRVRGEGGGGGR